MPNSRRQIEFAEKDLEGSGQGLIEIYADIWKNWGKSKKKISL
jgi:hypothetical protein